MEVVGVVVLVSGIGLEIACCVGVLVAPDVFDKLHFAGPAAVVGPGLIALAIALEERISQASLKAILVAVLLAAIGPVVSHATARSARIRQYGNWRPQEEER